MCDNNCHGNTSYIRSVQVVKFVGWFSDSGLIHALNSWDALARLLTSAHTANARKIRWDMRTYWDDCLVMAMTCIALVRIC